jgi:phage-related protein
MMHPAKSKRGRFAASPVRPVVWMGSSKSDLSAMPSEVKASFGVRLYELQQGATPLDMKPLPQFGAGFMNCARASIGMPIG